VRAARKAMDGEWGKLSLTDRKACLLRFAGVLESHKDELAVLDALDVGKPFEAAKGVDIGEVIATVTWYAEAIDKVYGQIAPTSEIDLILREPVGVVAAITPWNYPLMIAGWKFGPILAAGNTLILKPAEQSPLSALRTAELALEAGIPRGVFNVLTGDGTTGDELVRHGGVECIAFTGSTAVGKSILRAAAETSIRPVSLECGGKSAALICEDANLDQALPAIAGAVFYNAGQSCNAPTRILAPHARIQEVVEGLQHEASSYMPDNPLTSQTAVGCIVSREQLEHIVKSVESGLEEGGSVAFGGRVVHEQTGGFYFEPTVIADAHWRMRVSQEEIFGPVIPLEAYTSLDDAIVSANSTKYGLWATAWTQDIRTAVRMQRELRAGTVAINNGFGGNITTPLGGVKQSGIGRDRSLEALYKYTNIKHVHWNF
jgi:acyl-CoA reductase-like NAD-dependent aldehyde dehydrogenase